MNREKALIILILLFTFFSRAWRLDTPPTFYFDEVYHAFTAQAYAKNDPRGYEWWHQAPEGFAYEWLHPPLAKLIQAGSVKILGDKPFAWRFPGVIFATATVALLYFFGKSLFGSSFVGLAAALFYAVDGLSFAQSRITMNDSYLTFFLALSFYCFWILSKNQTRRNLFLTGLSLGLAAATKWTGFYGMAILGGLYFLINLSRNYRHLLKTLGELVIFFILLPLAIYFFSYSQFWLQGHTWAQFQELHWQTWWYQTHLTATHTYQSAALSWPFLVRPVWYYVNYGGSGGEIANIYAMGNPVVWWGGIVAIGYGLARSLRSATKFLLGFRFSREISLSSQKKSSALASEASKNLCPPPDLLGLSFVLIAYFGFFLPWALSPRIMFLYHYLPSVPFMCLALGWGLEKVWKRLRLLTISYLLLTILIFIYFYPHLSGLPVPKWLSESYFWFKSWR